MRAGGFFQVRPRYTPGSPAMVPEDTARRVAREEREGHARTLEGAYGPEAEAKAQREGLGGIAEHCEPRPEGWIVTDLITRAQVFRVPPGPALQPRAAARIGTKYGLTVRQGLEPRAQQIPEGAPPRVELEHHGRAYVWTGNAGTSRHTGEPVWQFEDAAADVCWFNAAGILSPDFF